MRKVFHGQSAQVNAVKSQCSDKVNEHLSSAKAKLLIFAHGYTPGEKVSSVVVQRLASG